MPRFAIELAVSLLPSMPLAAESDTSDESLQEILITLIDNASIRSDKELNACIEERLVCYKFIKLISMIIRDAHFFFTGSCFANSYSRQ